jgi:serine phosphatase RsbU (regulator of sigma subunit)
VTGCQVGAHAYALQVAEEQETRLGLAELLCAVENAPPVAAADVVGQRLADALGATAVGFLIADYSGQALFRLGHDGDGTATRTHGHETADRVPLSEGPHGRVLASQNVEIVDGASTVQVLAPVTSRGEAIGVLELRLQEEPDNQTLADIAVAAHALAYVVIANRRYTDLFEWGQRSVPLSLAAEIQHRLLPGSYTCEAGQFTVAGWLEPAGNCAGDTFDFSLERDTVHLSLTDAMGHDVAAAVLATVLVGALRNSRRAGHDLRQQASFASTALADHAHHCEFVTGQLVSIDLHTRTASIVNAGHVLPLRLRGGQVESVNLAADPPFGTVRDYRYRLQPLPLEPGDRLLFLTDGMLERNAADLDVPALVAASANHHPREAVQHLMTAVLETAGGELKDDATALCLDWHGGPERERTSAGGANR